MSMITGEHFVSGLDGPPRMGIASHETMINMENERKRVFLSWSGPVAKQVAGILKDWFENEVFEDLDAWVSDVDIAAGARALPAVEESLQVSVGGLLILTSENQSAPWVNFEAGALSQQFGLRSGQVIPLLVDTTEMSMLQAPLNQFQGQPLTHEGMSKVLKSLYQMQGKPDTHVASRMRAWPDVAARIQAVVNTEGGQARAKTVSNNDLQVQINRLERMVADLANGVEQGMRGPVTFAALRDARVDAEIHSRRLPTRGWDQAEEMARNWRRAREMVLTTFGSDILKFEQHEEGLHVVVDRLTPDDHVARSTEDALARIFGAPVTLVEASAEKKKPRDQTPNAWHD